MATLAASLLLACLPPVPTALAQSNGSGGDVELEALDELAFSAGLLGEYRADGRIRQRIDSDIAFQWGDATPVPQLPADSRFAVTWTGRLLIRQACQHQFHVFVRGRVRVVLDGQLLIDAVRQEPGWISSKAVPLSFGELPLRVEFEKTAAKAQIQLCWSSDVFALEPIPTHLLFLEHDLPQLRRQEQGRVALERFRCFRCHRRAASVASPPAADASPQPSAAADRSLAALPGPDLSYLGSGTSTEWLVRKLSTPAEDGAETCMPDFGFSRSEATAVVGYLRSISKDITFSSLKAPDDPAAERREGATLLRSLGCLACHRAGTLGQSGPFGGGDLSAIGRKRSHAWLVTWLREPSRLNADHRMPVFQLSPRERAQLAAALAAMGTGETNEPGETSETGEPGEAGEPGAEAPLKTAAADVELGRKLVVESQCAACHRLPGQAALVPFAAALDADADWKRACTALPVTDSPETAAGRLAARGGTVHRQPRYPHVHQADVDALQSYVRELGSAVSSVGYYERGRRVLERRNCLACHERGLELGLKRIAGQLAESDPDLRGQSEALIPPSLTAIGDKFPDRALRDAVAGRQAEARLPWLHVRMPRFEHDSDAHAALVAYLIGHDRIPDGAPRARVSTPADRDTTLLAGHTLVGPRGLSCVACHRIGDYAPKNVALGTRGSDLLNLAEQMRPEYFLRWTRSPMRIVPGMEMPSYVKPVRNILDQQIDTQLAAIWYSLSDSRFTPPTNPTSVEQFVTVKSGAAARIVRDVFTVPEADGGGYVPRALAMGFENGHSLLFDLDNLCIRHWCFGDMARQRTEGKSWFWDMAGLPIATGFTAQTDLRLTDAEGDIHLPVRDESTRGRLVAYRQEGLGVEFEYVVKFDAPQPATVHVRELFRPLPEADESSRGDAERGVERIIRVQGVPSASEMHCVLQSVTPAIRGARLTLRESGGSWVELDGGSAEMPHRLRGGEIAIRYLASPAIPDLPPSKPLPPQPTADGTVTSVPGFLGQRLQLSQSIMPTALCWTESGTLAFTSLKGHVYLAHDRNGDGVEDDMTVFEEGLAAPFGIIADGADLIVAHKPEVLRLRDTDGDGRADERHVVATGWGYSENYHDWTCGIVRDTQQRLYVGLGSDYAQPKRDPERARWRGTVLRIDRQGNIEPIAYSLRYPVGMAMNASDDVFVSDNQGVQNTFNEINHARGGLHFGVPSRYETDTGAGDTPPAVRIPHPWTRSVNGLCFLPTAGAASESAWSQLAGHGIGCEYDSRFLIRFTLQRVGDTYQGATYYFSDPAAGADATNFLGPMCAAVSPSGDLYVGSIHDSGWLGGQNTGEIVRLRPERPLTNGIRELRAHAGGFELDFFAPVDRERASDGDNYQIQGYTRVWQGGYATPDSERYKANVEQIDVADDGRRVRLFVDRLRPGFVYEVSCAGIAGDGQSLFPATGHYTLNRLPESSEQ